MIWTNESAPLWSWFLTYLENHVRSPVTVIVETTLELEREQSNINSKNKLEYSYYSECIIP